jgi:hypothetical protein
VFSKVTVPPNKEEKISIGTTTSNSFYLEFPITFEYNQEGKVEIWVMYTNQNGNISRLPGPNLPIKIQLRK